MFINFFIKRPVFASVCSIIIVLLGSVSIFTLPITLYPNIIPKQVSVTANYIGADAETVENAVTTILERQINGVDGMRYITSSSSNDGTSTIRVTFDSGWDQNIAAVDVQNRVSLAEPELPEEVIQNGIKVNKESSNILLIISLYAKNGEYNTLFLSNYADLYLVDALKRVNGVGNIVIFGERTYAMRLWLDPNRLTGRNLTAQDVVQALEEQNIQVGAGRIGQQPMPREQRYEIDLRAVSRLTDVSQFEEIVIATGENGALVKLKDVGRVELGAQNYSSFLRAEGKDAIGLGIYQVPGSNALNVVKDVKAAMVELAKNFPSGISYNIASDSTNYIQASLSEVVIALIEAIISVTVIIFVFLQSWRTAVVALITIPVSFIGTFIFVKVFNFSINSLTLFGLALATGMVVDDAIIIVEDITTKIQNQGLSPRQAAMESMHQLMGAVIATSLVLMAVFVPVAFFTGTTGALYNQFALTIAFSTTISTFNALTLTPTLSGLFLRQKPPSQGWVTRIFGVLNRCFDWLQRCYGQVLRFLIRLQVLVMAGFIACLGLTLWLYTHVPTAFLPDEDQGYFITIIQAPEGVSLSYTSEVIKQVEDIILALPEVDSTDALGGFSFNGNTSNNGVIFVNLIPWEKRHGPEHSVQGIINRLQGQLSAIPEAKIISVNPPPIEGLSNFGGFQFQIEDRRGNLDLNTLVKNMEKFLKVANQQPVLLAVFSTYAASTPQLLVEVNRNRAKALQVSLSHIFDTLQTYLGSRYVNNFRLERRTYRVYVQADQQFRNHPEAINQLYVRSARGDMISLSNLVTITPTTGAQTINHYNLFRSIEINGSSAPGVSSGDAIKAMERVAAQVLPPGISYEWSGTSLEEIESGRQAPIIFGLGLLLVFLVLAAQYESYTDPIIIILSVPLAILGALAAQLWRGLPNDVYCQIGLVMLIGLASKNAILIVEFANQLRDEGLPIPKAATEAAKQRLRPILMTTISTLVGTFPLIIATGAGAGSQQSLGTTVFGGMLIATFLSLFIVPVLYVIISGCLAKTRVTKNGGDFENNQ